MRPATDWFLDTSYALALASRSDAGHEKARGLAERLMHDRVALVTTQAVLIEIGNALSKVPKRALAVLLLERLKRDPTVQVIEVGEKLFAEAFRMYRSHSDKEWGLTDCISFTVMRQRGIREALTADHHFEQAGFRALLRNTR